MTQNINESATVVEEPVTIGFRVKESSGETVLSMDEYSNTAIESGYDALRASVIATTNDNPTGAREALAIVEAAAPRAAEAGKALVSKGAALAALALKPGGKASDRAQLRAVMKGALRAYRVGYGKRK